jgi:hypothetical protein
MFKGELIRLLSNFSIALPAIAILFRLHVRSKVIYYLLVLVLISAAVDLMTALGKPNLTVSVVLINLQDLIQFLLITLIYREMYVRDYKLAVMLILAIYLLAVILNTIYFQSITVLQNYNWTLAAVLIVFMAIGWMLNVLITLPVKRLIHFGEFWINTSFFCYFSISLFLFLSANYVFKGQSLEAKIFFWSFHNVNNVLKNVLLSIGVYYFSERFADNKLQVV